MKKLLAFALALSMVLSLAACGSKNVTVTIPAAFMAGATQEDLDEGFPDYIKSTKLNDDGSVTVTMTEEHHDEVMAEIAEDLDGDLEDMVEDEDYSNFAKIEHNEDFTHFDVALKEIPPTMLDYMSLMVLYSYGGMYNIFAGNGGDVKVTVDFRTTDGVLLESSDNSNMIGSMIG